MKGRAVLTPERHVRLVEPLDRRHELLKDELRVLIGSGIGEGGKSSRGVGGRERVGRREACARSFVRRTPKTQKNQRRTRTLRGDAVLARYPTLLLHRKLSQPLLQTSNPLRLRPRLLLRRPKLDLLALRSGGEIVLRRRQACSAELQRGFELRFEGVEICQRLGAQSRQSCSKGGCARFLRGPEKAKLVRLEFELPSKRKVLSASGGLCGFERRELGLAPAMEATVSLEGGTKSLETHSSNFVALSASWRALAS